MAESKRLKEDDLIELARLQVKEALIQFRYSHFKSGLGFGIPDHDEPAEKADMAASFIVRLIREVVNEALQQSRQEES
jgi:hypothetical protein